MPRSTIVIDALKFWYNFFMKLMSYNILNGGVDRLSLIIDAIKQEKPDYLTINEANTFAKDNNKILKAFAQQIGLPYYDIALSGEYDYPVAIFSKGFVA